MKRREFISLLGGAATWPLMARAQQSERMRHIGVLMASAADDSESQARMAAFLQGLAQLGWTDGRNVRIDTRWATTSADDLRRHAAELAALAPDVLVAATGTATVAPLLQATRTLPIVFVVVIDPVGAGFVASLAANRHRDLIATLAAQHRLPAVYSGRQYVAAGGLISYGPDLIDQYRRAAGYVDRVLKGEKPADLPVQAPTKYELVINLKTAKALGLEIPPALLARADEVIE